LPYGVTPNATIMLQQPEETFQIESIINNLYKVDFHINDQFRHIRSSFTNSATLFKSIYRPLQLNCKKRNTDNSRDAEIKKCTQALASLSMNIQFHDVLEQKLKHLKQAHSDLIQELMALKKTIGSKTMAVKFARQVALLSHAQLNHILIEYSASCTQTDSAVDEILLFVQQSMTALNEEDVEGLDAVKQKIKNAINTYKLDLSYRRRFEGAIEESIPKLSLVFASLNLSERSAIDTARFKRIQDLYTIESERSIFNLTFRRGQIEQPKLVREDSGVDFFL
jgi:hypothetical protein